MAVAALPGPAAEAGNGAATIANENKQTEKSRGSPTNVKVALRNALNISRQVGCAGCNYLAQKD
jgi:hypothetical protein